MSTIVKRRRKTARVKPMYDFITVESRDSGRRWGVYGHGKYDSGLVRRVKLGEYRTRLEAKLANPTAIEATAPAKQFAIVLPND